MPRILQAEHTHFIPRAQAEQDPSQKQLIPYVLIQKGRRVPALRAGQGVRGEAAGGEGIHRHRRPHQPRDENLFQAGLEFYEEALQRELHEELRMDGHFRTRIVALLNDDATPVGQVHLGVVHLCELGDENVSKGEACITDLRFLTVRNCTERREQLENWSQLC